jgi:hypothetical protein
MWVQDRMLTVLQYEYRDTTPITYVVAPENWRTELAFNFKRQHRGRKGVRAALIDGSIYHLGRAGSALCEDAAWSIVQAQRGLHPIWVFPYRGRRVSTMNNTACTLQERR